MKKFSGSRAANILQFFRKKSIVTVSALASWLTVSERTVRNDIKQLQQELQKCAVIENAQGRYSLHVFDEECFRIIYTKLLNEDNLFNSPNSRMNYIFGRLMRAEIAVYQLSIIGKTSRGLTLQGLESNIRYYILDNNYVRLYGEYPLDHEIAEILTTMFDNCPFEKSVQEAFRQFLILMLDRFLTGHPIGQLSPSFYRLMVRDEFKLVSQMLERITEVLRVEFPLEEKLFVLLPIIGMRTPADIRDTYNIVLDESMRPLMDKILRRIRMQTDITIRSGEFTEEFLYHLMFMINRLRFHVRLENPVLEDLRGKYPLAWKMAGTAVQVIEEETSLEVTEDERGYLASYFGVFLEEYGVEQDKRFRVAVVCGTGRVTARLIAAQLKKVLDSSTEISLFADKKVNREILADYNIILTTVELLCPCDRPVIYIREVFNEQELRHKIEKAKYWDQIDVPILDNNWFVMASLLDESRFFVLKDAESYDTAVTQMVKGLAASGQVDEGFLDRLRKREQKGTMAFDHAIAIPHSIQYAWNKLVLAVGVLPEPLQYRNHKIQVIFLIGLPEQLTLDDSLLIRLYDEIISITRDTEMISKIAAADSFQSLLHVLYRKTGD